MPCGLIHYNLSQAKIEYNPSKAKKLLAEAGYPNGVDMEIALVASTGSQWQKMSEGVQSMVMKSGFRVKLVQMDEAAFYATRKEGKLPMYTNKWSADFNDPDNFYYTFFGEKGTVARSYNNISPEVFKALDKGRAETNFAKRGKLYADLEKKICIDQAAWFPMFSEKHLWVLGPKVKKYRVLEWLVRLSGLRYQRRIVISYDQQSTPGGTENITPGVTSRQLASAGSSLEDKVCTETPGHIHSCPDPIRFPEICASGA